MNKTHITPSTPTHKAIQSPKQSDYHKIFSTRLFYCFIRESFFTLPKACVDCDFDVWPGLPVEVGFCDDSQHQVRLGPCGEE